MQVSEALSILLIWGDWSAARAAAQRTGSNPAELFDLHRNHDAAWLAIQDEALEAWTAVYPGSRPESWWLTRCRAVPERCRFTEAPGLGRCQIPGIPYGAPDDWEDRPMVESTPAYLDRLDLWVAGERGRVPRRAFDPQPFSWTLTVAPCGMPKDDLEDDDDDDAGRSLAMASPPDPCASSTTLARTHCGGDRATRQPKAMRRDLARLLRRSKPNSAARLLAAIAAAVQGHSFSAAELLAHTAVDPDLSEALQGITTRGHLRSGRKNWPDAPSAVIDWSRFHGPKPGGFWACGG